MATKSSECAGCHQFNIINPLLTCSKCTIPLYCGEICQKKHAVEHSLVCPKDADTAAQNNQITKQMAKAFEKIASPSLFHVLQDQAKLKLQYVGTNVAPSMEYLREGMEQAIEYAIYALSKVLFDAKDPERLPEACPYMQGQIEYIPAPLREPYMVKVELWSWMGRKQPAVTHSLKFSFRKI